MFEEDPCEHSTGRRCASRKTMFQRGGLKLPGAACCKRQAGKETGREEEREEEKEE